VQPTPLCKPYEHLRSYVLEASNMPGQVYGLGVMLRQGMRAWIDATLEYAQLKQDPGNAVLQKTSWIFYSATGIVPIISRKDLNLRIWRIWRD